MATLTHNTRIQNIQHASGEQLLLLAVFGTDRLRQRINRELDRRARLTRDVSRHRPAMHGPASSFAAA